MSKQQALKLLEAARAFLDEFDSGRVQARTIAELRRAIASAELRVNNPRIGD